MVSKSNIKALLICRSLITLIWPSFHWPPLQLWVPQGWAFSIADGHSEANAIFLRCQRDLEILSSIISSLIFIHVVWRSIGSFYAAHRCAGGTLCKSEVYVWKLHQDTTLFTVYGNFITPEAQDHFCYAIKVLTFGQEYVETLNPYDKASQSSSSSSLTEYLATFYLTNGSSDSSTSSFISFTSPLEVPHCLRLVYFWCFCYI